jgi:hypothetical protein
MPSFRTIEIDFAIHKLIESERQSFDETPNAVLRRLLSVKDKPSPRAGRMNGSAGHAWSGDGVTLPHGTAIRMRYNGRHHEGEIVDGKWIVDAKSFDTPSGAASGIAITKRGKKTRLDGWTYWEARVPGDTTWTPISALRQKSNRTTTLTAQALGL